jgi:hypothetical protein
VPGELADLKERHATEMAGVVQPCPQYAGSTSGKL